MLGSFPSSQSLQVVCCSATFTEKAGSDSLNHPQIRASVETWCPDRYDVEIPNNSIIVSGKTRCASSVDNTSEVSINPLITQDIHVCSEHKKIRKLMDFIRVEAAKRVVCSLCRSRTRKRRSGRRASRWSSWIKWKRESSCWTGFTRSRIDRVLRLVELGERTVGEAEARPSKAEQRGRSSGRSQAASDRFFKQPNDAAISSYVYLIWMFSISMFVGLSMICC